MKTDGLPNLQVGLLFLTAGLLVMNYGQDGSLAPMRPYMTAITVVVAAAAMAGARLMRLIRNSLRLPPPVMTYEDLPGWHGWLTFGSIFATMVLFAWVALNFRRMNLVLWLPALAGVGIGLTVLLRGLPVSPARAIRLACLSAVLGVVAQMWMPPTAGAGAVLAGMGFVLTVIGALELQRALKERTA